MSLDETSKSGLTVIKETIAEEEKLEVESLISNDNQDFEKDQIID